MAKSPSEMPLAEAPGGMIIDLYEGGLPILSGASSLSKMDCAFLFVLQLSSPCNAFGLILGLVDADVVETMSFSVDEEYKDVLA
jgi:hypothetical protein